MTEDTLQRFYEALIEALRERGPSDLERPFTVAEIYQDLVPYRTHRDRLGVEMNGDYEHALLRLLAGEGGYLRLESEHALRDIRGELEEKSPNTTVYRDYAAVDVRIDPFVLRSGEGEGEAETAEFEVETEGPEEDAEEAAAEAVEPEMLDSLAPDAGAAPDTSDAETAFFSGAAPATSMPARASGEAAAAATTKGGEDGHCAWCRSELPKRDTINYCPFCGQDQSLTPCRSCGEALEAGWQFCIVCGAQAAS